MKKLINHKNVMGGGIRYKKSTIVIIILLLLISLIGGSYAFYSVFFKDERMRENSNVTTDHLSNATIVSDIPNGIGSFSMPNIYPGHKEVLGLTVTGSGEVNSKSYFEFKYKVLENGLNDNVKISLYRNYKPIEITENFFSCEKKNVKIENTSDTKYYETCKEKELGLLLEETILNGGQEEVVIGRDSLTILKENVDITKYYYVVVEFLNLEKEQNELMNRKLNGKVSVELTPPFDVDYTNNIEAEVASLNESYASTETFSIHVTSEKYRIVSMSENLESWEELEDKGKDITIEKTVTENGNYTYYFQDEAENIQEITMVSTKVDKEPPTLNVVAEEYLDGVKIDASASIDTKSGIKSYYYKLNDGEYIESTDSVYTYRGLSDGEYKVTVKISDNAENISEEKSLVVVVAYQNVYVRNNGNDNTGNGSIDKPYATLQRAYNKVKSGGNIILLSDITATETTNMNIENKSVTLKSEGTNKYSITKDNNLKSQILYVEKSNQLTTENIIFDGNNVESTGSLIEGFSSTITLNNTILQNNINNGRQYTEFNIDFAIGGGILVSESTLNIKSGSTIQYNKVNNANISFGGGIGCVKSTINLNGGIITKNAFTNVYVNGNRGGGIAVLYDSAFQFLNGEISNNNAIVGAGVFVALGSWVDGVGKKSTMNMSGGTILNNTATENGGGITLNTSDFNMNGGTIYNNNARYGGGVTISSSNGTSNGTSFMTVTAGVITNNNASLYGGGIYAYKDKDASTQQVIVHIKSDVIENNTAPTGPNTYALNGAQILQN